MGSLVYISSLLTVEILIIFLRPVNNYMSDLIPESELYQQFIQENKDGVFNTRADQIIAWINFKNKFVSGSETRNKQEHRK